MFGKELIQQLMVDAKPYMKELMKEVLAEEQGGGDVLSVEYGEAGRIIGTTYEGIRKMVRMGKLKAVKRGRRRGIAMSELRLFVQTNTN